MIIVFVLCMLGYDSLVYEKSTGALIGFSDVGGVIQQLNEHEHLVAGKDHNGH